MPWQMGLPQPATAIMQELRWFEQFTLWFIIPITLLVLFLLAWCMIRYRASANPVPSRTSHNTTIEVIWTVAPVDHAADDRRALLPAADFAVQPAGRSRDHHQGHRPAVVLGI
jgi:hypothetical protein